MENKQAYIVQYSTGSYDDYYQELVFVTYDKEKAIDYCQKFNAILDKWFRYYDELLKGLTYDDELCKKYWSRWNGLGETNGCLYTPIEIR
jgi:hypothetical protein